MLGSSYEGFTVVMALVNPHPALKVAAPMSPMVDGWMGDDWFHYGAFRQVNFDYFTGQTDRARARAIDIARAGLRRLRELPPRRLGRRLRARQPGLDQLPCWRKITEHPAYDAFWQEQALDKTMAAQPLKVPTMWIQGLVGPGGHVGRDPRLPGDRAQGHRQRQELSRHGAVAPQPA